jgi:hypothetical protein
VDIISVGHSKEVDFAELYAAYARDVCRFALHLRGDTVVAQDET